MSEDDASSAPSTHASALTAAVLDEEAARQAGQAERSADVVFADDLLPGVGGEEMPLNEVIDAYEEQIISGELTIETPNAPQ